MLLLYFFAMLLAIFSPMDNWLIQIEKEKIENENAKLKSIIFVVDQLRIALPAYRQDHPDEERELHFGDVKSYIQKEIADVNGMEQYVDGTLKQYVDKDSFYIEWKKVPPPPGLAHMLVEHYSRPTGDPNNKYAIVFYNVGFAEAGGAGTCLRTVRKYTNIDETFPCPYPLYPGIEPGALVLTDRPPDPAAVISTIKP